MLSQGSQRSDWFFFSYSILHWIPYFWLGFSYTGKILKNWDIYVSLEWAQILYQTDISYKSSTYLNKKQPIPTGTIFVQAKQKVTGVIMELK